VLRSNGRTNNIGGAVKWKDKMIFFFYFLGVKRNLKKNLWDCCGSPLDHHHFGSFLEGVLAPRNDDVGALYNERRDRDN
jgi:hypothetical protein